MKNPMKVKVRMEEEEIELVLQCMTKLIHQIVYTTYETGVSIATIE